MTKLFHIDPSRSAEEGRSFRATLSSGIVWTAIASSEDVARAR